MFADKPFAVEQVQQHQQLAYKCKLCPKRFSQCSALGGHISKAHPGMSEAYNHKKKVRDLRELERELHNHAIQVYRDYYGDNAGGASASKGGSVAASGFEHTDPQRQSSMVIDDLTIQHNSVSMVSDKANSLSRSQVNRNTIKRIKKDLVFKDPKYNSLKRKFLGNQGQPHLASQNEDSAASNNELEADHLLGSEDQSY